MTTPYSIELATPADVPALADIELAAARLLSGYASEAFLAETTSTEAFEAARASGHLWVARADGAPVGFAQVTLREPGVAHLEELDVHPAHGRRGIGRRLVTTVCEWAAREGFRAVTLTTFRDVPFNMPFYRALGFEVLRPEELGPVLATILEAESHAGLERRVGMRRMSSG
jgi:GNAT superfamily N-acetyltransferase